MNNCFLRLLLVLIGTLPTLSLAAAPPNFLSTPAGKAPSNEALRDQADDLIKAAMAHEHFSGNVLIARDGKVVFRESYGFASRELEVANAADTVFRIASLSKQFTAAAVLQLQQAGKLRVQDRICQHISPCPEAWSSVSLHHLLTHTSGIPNYSSLPDWDERYAKQDLSHDELIRLVQPLPLQFEPGSQHRYTNTGYYLLGLIIEKVSGKPYRDYLKEQIFAPLGMHSSLYDDLGTVIPRSATGYRSRGTHFVSAPYGSAKALFAAGGIHSTVDDLLRWHLALQYDTVLSQASRNAMFEAGIGGYGYGWYLRTFFDRQAQLHSGSALGFSAFIIRFPTEKLSAIVLSNSDRASASGLGLRLSALALGVPVQLPKPQLRDLLFDLIETQGVSAAAKQYRSWKESNAQDFDYDEEVLTDVGYDLFEAQRFEEANTLYQLNLEYFPKSYVSLDLMADILAIKGKHAEAIVLYHKSLKIEPNNGYAKRALERIYNHSPQLRN